MRHRMAAIALSLAALTAPAGAQQFSADVVSNSGNQPSPGKLYVSNGKVRMEGGGGHGTLLADSRANTLYVLIPQQKAYMDMPTRGPLVQILTPVDADNPCPQWQKVAEAAHKDMSGWSCKRVGSDAVNGRSAVKYQATATDGKIEYAWIDTKLRFLVKTQDAAGRGMELQNIQEAVQPASLFELPADYRKLDIQQMLQQHREQGTSPP